MSLIVNGTTVNTIYCDSVKVNKVMFNGTQVYSGREIIYLPTVLSSETLCDISYYKNTLYLSTIDSNRIWLYYWSNGQWYTETINKLDQYGKWNHKLVSLEGISGSSFASSGYPDSLAFVYSPASSALSRTMTYNSTGYPHALYPTLPNVSNSTLLNGDNGYQLIQKRNEIWNFTSYIDDYRYPHILVITASKYRVDSTTRYGSIYFDCPWDKFYGTSVTNIIYIYDKSYEEEFLFLRTNVNSYFCANISNLESGGSIIISSVGYMINRVAPKRINAGLPNSLFLTDIDGRILSTTNSLASKNYTIEKSSLGVSSNKISISGNILVILNQNHIYQYDNNGWVYDGIPQ